MVEKKLIKIAAVGVAAVALVIGLAVGISKSQQNKNASAVQSNSYAAIDEVSTNGEMRAWEMYFFAIRLYDMMIWVFGDQRLFVGGCSSRRPGVRYIIS
jgi:hypothetical protein